MIDARTEKRGRPKTGLSPILTVTVPAAVLARIDALAAERFEARRATVRHLLDAGLAAQRRPLACREPGQ